jgi:hypothetical protein
MQEDAMTRRSRFTCVGAFLLASVVAVAAAADTVDKRTTFTFNTPVAVPGTTLPAGSYLFRVADVDSHNVVQVLSGDGKTPYAMFFALQTWRSAPSADPDLTFIETAADMPHAIRTWWYPGETIGYEFMYSREQARLLARGSGTPVASIDTKVPGWTEPTWIPPTYFETEPPAVAPTEPAAIEAAPAEQPAELEAVPSTELSKSGSPLTVMLATAIALVAFAAAMQLFATRKHT